MKSQQFNMVALHIEEELPSLLVAPEHTPQHCWSSCKHHCRNALTQVTQISNLTIYTRLMLCPQEKTSKGVRSGIARQDVFQQIFIVYGLN